MQYTDTGAALIGGLISTYFFQPAVFASLKDACSRVLPCSRASAPECAHFLRPSADSEGCEFSDAHVPVEPADTARAYGCQCKNNRAAEYFALITILRVYLKSQK